LALDKRKEIITIMIKKSYSKVVYGQTLDFPNACFEITYLSGTKENIIIVVNIYDNLEKKNLLDTKSYNYKPDLSDNTPNNFYQGYAYLKSLPEFIDAIDLDN
jgi:hypothetical protein